ncbi:MAG: DUF1538 family protein, partial [Treponema sp.]|nr:DUF1538 family protein [Treponema sp.]
PLTVPFILALGLGVSSVRQGDNQSFGLTGVTSVGPVLAVLCYSFIAASKGTSAVSVISEAEAVIPDAVQDSGLFTLFLNVLPGVLKEAAVSILPLLAMFGVFQITLLKMSPRQVIRMIIGFGYSFIGLVIFLTGVNGGFMQAGKELGLVLGQKAFELGGWWFALLIGTGLALGAIVVCAEPAVWVLTEQVESVSGGTISRKALLVFLSVGSAVAIGLALWRAVSGFSIKYILVPGYAISLLLMIFCPSLFTGIAFDSGGVASGPITSTFVLSFALGASSLSSGNSRDVFGVIAMVAMTPLIAIQILGIIYRIKTSKKGGTEE